MSVVNRKIIDCRDFPNEIGCTLLIAGSPGELLKAAVRHAVEEHGHKDTPELRRQIKMLMKDETAGELLKTINKNKLIKSVNKKGTK
jgi:hypothetical protein